jgi:hypothetical protein
MLTIDATSTFAERMAVYQAIGGDALVPDFAMLLVPRFLSQLGSKVGTVCALLVSSEQDSVSSRWSQIVAGEQDLRVGLFHDEAEAGRWLRGYVAGRERTQPSSASHRRPVKSTGFVNRSR